MAMSNMQQLNEVAPEYVAEYVGRGLTACRGVRGDDDDLLTHR